MQNPTHKRTEAINVNEPLLLKQLPEDVVRFIEINLRCYQSCGLAMTLVPHGLGGHVQSYRHVDQYYPGVFILRVASLYPAKRR